MPTGDPAGYLPNVIKKRKARVKRKGSIQKAPAIPGQFPEKIAPKGFRAGKPKPFPRSFGPDATKRRYLARAKRKAT